MKNVIRTVALVSTFGLMSGLVFADQNEGMNDPEANDPQMSVDSANDPSDGQDENTGSMTSDEPVITEEENITDSANDPGDSMTDAEGQLDEDDELAPDSGVDSANDADD